MTRIGPFGLWMGMKLEEVGSDPEEVAPSKYRITTVPKSHSAFEQYILQISPKHGLSWIKAVGHTIQSSVFGLELNAAFNEFERKLSAAYGEKGEKSDLLMPDSIWNEQRDWMQSLLNKERYLMKIWSSENGSSLPDPLSSVMILATAVDESSGYISIEYSYNNCDSAEEEISGAEDEAL